ncbi:MAG TPA: hypothetical protein VNQ77_17095 [Frankiaceae bacterium]|nr:hypothetical protein [Frankiaceae bacterium]
MRSITLAAAGVLAATAVLGAGSPALAEDVPAPEVQWVNGNVVVNPTDPTAATVVARYRCYGGPNHLWVSVKQGEHLGDEAHAAELTEQYADQLPPGEVIGPFSSFLADAWADTNYLFDPNVGPLAQADCDGEWHTDRVTVRSVDGFDALSKGAAWVQFCLYTAGGFATNEGWRTVKSAVGKA